MKHKEDILKNVENMLIPSLFTNILQHIFFYVPQMKESYTGLEWYKRE